MRDKIGKMTNDLYNRYIFTKSETVEISFEDQNTIRDLSNCSSEVRLHKERRQCEINTLYN